ncbi:MAG: flagellar type III secretion system pore protein FliP [bacterium]
MKKGMPAVRGRAFRIALLIGPLLLVAFLTVGDAQAQTPLPSVNISVGQADSPQDLSVTIQILLLLTVLTLAPSILVMTTSFVRIIVAFHFLRQAMGTQTLPPNQVIVGLALFMTIAIMQPVINDIYENAWLPYSQQQITLQQGWDRAKVPMREFMLRQTREKDLDLFVKISKLEQPGTPADLPMSVIIPAFMTSELRIGFQIGFLVYLPMLVVDMVVASVLMSMGMMMLPPIMISLPFKLLLFVLVDGWYLVVQSLVESFR